MGNIMASLYTGVSGLQVSQASLNIAAHNVANANTKGYVRQQAIITDSFYSTIGTNDNSKLQIGSGVTVSTVRQYRNQFLDKQYRLEVGRESFYEVQSEAVLEIEDLFGELQGEQFSEAITDLWSAQQELAKMPEDIACRDLFVSAANTFTERAKVLSNQFKEYQVSLNTRIMSDVKNINSIATQILSLNKEICKYESGTEQANDYRDARNLLLDELGGYAKFNIQEYVNGIVTVSIEGYPLVSEDRSYSMGVVQINDASKMLKPIWLESGGGDVFDESDLAYTAVNNADVGSLKGILVARGSYAADYTVIPIQPNEADYTDVSGTLDAVKYKVAMNTYNDELDIYNKTVNNSTLMTVQAQLDQLIHGIVTSINDTLCPNKEIALFDGSVIKVLDEENCPVGCDSADTKGTELFSRKNVQRYTSMVVTRADGSIQTVQKYNEEKLGDDFSLYSISQLEINHEMLQDSSLLALKSNSSSDYKEGYSQETLDDLLASWTNDFSKLDPNSLTTYSFQNYYTAMIGNVGTIGSIANGIISNQSQLVNSIENERLRITGVSSDEELVDMIKFQHAYNASSRYITVIDQMLQQIIEKLG